MKKLISLSFAVTALIPASAAAQTVVPPEKWQDTPDARLNVPAQPKPPAPRAPAPGVTWQQPAPNVRVETRTAPVAPPPPVRAEVRAAPVAPPPPVAVQTRPAPPPAVHAEMRPAPVVVQRHRERVEQRVPVRRQRFPHVSRVGRGFFVPPGWFAPQFHIRNWGLYGFPQPYQDRRWIRYYDDALLVDHEGRVHDGRYGLDWDRYGEPWSYDRGVPEYVGDGDFYPDDEDYAYVDGYDESYADMGHHGVYPGGHGGYSYAYPAYGYGYGWGGVTITETIVTTAPVVTEHIVYDYEDVPVKRHRRAKKVYKAKAPPYVGGEKG